MSEPLPPSVVAYALRYLHEELNFAYLHTDDEGRLKKAGGALATYGITNLIYGTPAEDQIEFLMGLLPLPEKSLVLNAVRTGNGAVADIHLWRDAHGYWVMLLDVSAEHDRQQRMQQKGNEVSLRSERQAQILTTHIGKSIAEELLQGRWAVRGSGERRQVTILFADIRDFTPFSEAHSPEVVFRTLNQYIPAMVDPIHLQGGIVDKIAGDAVMADFGLVGDGTVGARQAYQAAMQILVNVDKVNAERERLGERCLGVGIGIATGPVAVGIIGTLERRGFTAIGHHVNFAARLQGYARAGEIVIDEDTHRALDGQDIAFRELTLMLKGFRDPVRVYAHARGRDS